MQKCKFLDDLGLKINQYGTNFISDKDKRRHHWKKQRKKYGFDDRETWCLERTFVEWIYTRVKMYKKSAGKIVNLSFHKIQYKDKEFTQLELMNLLLNLAREALVSDDNELLTLNTREICDIWKELSFYMWW